MKRAWLYCTAFPGCPMFLGEIEHEGSLRDRIQAHCGRYGDAHATQIHLVVEGTPEHAEVADGFGFPQLALSALPEWAR